MVNRLINDKHVLYNDPNSMLKLYHTLDAYLKHFNKCYYLVSNKIKPLNKMKSNDKISVKNSNGSFFFQVDSCCLYQPISRWLNNQSRNRFFKKFFMITDYYHKICLQIQDINTIYPKVFSSVCSMYENLGENLLCILNTLLITYKNDIYVQNLINFLKKKISDSKNFLYSNFELKKL